MKENSGESSGADPGMASLWVSAPPNISQISDEELGALVRRRAQPGVLILDPGGEIRYLNPDAKRFLEALTIKSSRRKSGFLSLPHAVEQLYLQFKEVIRFGREDGTGLSSQTVNRICIYEEAVYLFRALALQSQDGENPNAHILILIERVSQRLPVDQVIQSIRLTQREQAVVRLLLEGRTNKEVAGAMNIGEYTVKDHVKRIMKKLQVGTRAGIVAKILQQSRPS